MQICFKFPICMNGCNYVQATICMHWPNTQQTVKNTRSSGEKVRPWGRHSIHCSQQRCVLSFWYELSYVWCACWSQLWRAYQSRCEKSSRTAALVTGWIILDGDNQMCPCVCGGALDATAVLASSLPSTSTTMVFMAEGVRFLPRFRNWVPSKFCLWATTIWMVHLYLHRLARFNTCNTSTLKWQALPALYHAPSAIYPTSQLYCSATTYSAGQFSR